MDSQEFIKGTLKPIILKLISENKRMYGYQITQEVKRITVDKINLTEGALYPALHKLVDEGILEVETEYVGNRIRKYYSLTDYGKEIAPQRLKEVKDIILAMINLFDLIPEVSK